MRQPLLSLFLLFALAGVTAAGPSAVVLHFAYEAKTAKPAKEIVRDAKKAAVGKKKELREQGVKNVRVKSPGDWPSRIPAPADMTLREVPLPPGEKGKLYESDNYSFRTPCELSPDGQKMIAQIFECTNAANTAIGKVLPVPRTEVSRAEKKYPVELVRNDSAYHAAGGPSGSAGVFQHAERIPVINGIPQNGGPKTEDMIAQERVLVPFTSLGLDEQGRLTAKGHDINTHTLVHEITHQNFVLNNLPITMNEGWAEYVGYVPYIGTELDFDRGFSLILHEAKKYAGTGALDFPFSLEDFLTMDQETMYGFMQQGSNSRNTYLLSCMVVAYFVHLDGKKGIEALRTYMRDVADGKPNEEAVRELIASHRNTKQLEKDFLRAWKAKGVKGMSFK